MVAPNPANDKPTSRFSHAGKGSLKKPSLTRKRIEQQILRHDVRGHRRFCASPMRMPFMREPGKIERLE